MQNLKLLKLKELPPDRELSPSLPSDITMNSVPSIFPSLFHAVRPRPRFPFPWPLDTAFLLSDSRRRFSYGDRVPTPAGLPSMVPEPSDSGVTSSFVGPDP